MKEERPTFAASYGVSAGNSGMIAWLKTRERLLLARNYWIATADSAGMPHSTPVWGVWMDDCLYFGTDSRSRKASNLAENPRAVVHLESGDDVVIVHCTVGTVDEADIVNRVLQLYRDKYSMPEDFEFAPVLCATPTRGYAWIEAEFPNTATKYVR